jgi:ribonuclease III
MFNFSRIQITEKSASQGTPQIGMSNNLPTPISGKRLKELDHLSASLGISFGRMGLLNEALTHSSYAVETGDKDYERLEFFGDAVLKFVISEYLLERFADYDEGKLTEIRAVLVSDKILAELANTVNLSKYILLGKQVQMRPSIMARSMEAIFGAVYTDLGLITSQNLIVRLFGDHATAVDRDEFKENYKAKLQELTQSKGQGIPAYSIVSVEGPAHNPTFEVSVGIDGQLMTMGKGSTKKAAEQEAAKFALEKLGVIVTEMKSKMAKS